MKKKILEIGKHHILVKRGRWIYEERGLFIEDKIKQLRASQELPDSSTVDIKHTRHSGTRKNINHPPTAI